MIIKTTEYNFFYRILWEKVLAKYYGGQIPKRTKRKYTAYVWRQLEYKKQVDFDFIKNSEIKDVGYFYRKYSELANKTGGTIDDICLINGLEFLGYKSQSKITSYADMAEKLFQKFLEENLFDIYKTNENETSIKQHIDKNDTKLNISDIPVDVNKAYKGEIIIDSIFFDCIEKITTFYKARLRRHSPYTIESKLFHEFKEFVKTRVDIMENELTDESVKELTDYFLSRKWIIYEKVDDLIIKRLFIAGRDTHQFPRPTKYGFTCKANYFYKSKIKPEKVSCNFNLAQHLLAINVSGIMANKANDIHRLTFSYRSSYQPRIFSGHKLYFERKSGELKMKTLIMLPVENSQRVARYSKCDIYDRSVPELVRAVLLHVEEVEIDPIPYRHKLISLNDIWAKNIAY